MKPTLLLIVALTLSGCAAQKPSPRINALAARVSVLESRAARTERRVDFLKALAVDLAAAWNHFVESMKHDPPPGMEGPHGSPGDAKPCCTPHH